MATQLDVSTCLEVGGSLEGDKLKMNMFFEVTVFRILKYYDCAWYIVTKHGSRMCFVYSIGS